MWPSVFKLFVLAIVTATAAHGASTDQTNAAIRRLHQAAVRGQWQDNVAFDTFTLTFGHRKGSFQSNVRVNVIGDPIMQAVRQLFSIPDDNGFLVPFMTNAFLRAGLARPDLVPVNDTSLNLAMESLLGGVDPTRAAKTPAFGFWPWKCPVGGQCRQHSINMNPIMQNGEILAAVIIDLVNATGEDKWLEPIAETIEDLCQQFTLTFNIPADADDTGINVGMAYLLEQHEAILPRSVSTWRAQEFDLEAAARLLVEYSYCPADAANRSRGSVDPRSYFWARDFFRTLTAPDECIITTWLQNYDEELAVYRRAPGAPGCLMPFNVNNVDPTVATNALFGLSTILLRNQTAWFTGRAKTTYLTTARFLAWTIANQRNISRPDIETLYYPTGMNMLAFTGRHLRLLRSHEATGKPWPVPAMQTVLELLDGAMRSGGVPYLAGIAKNTAACSSASMPQPPTSSVSDTAAQVPIAMTCWDGFLGEKDQGWLGEPAPSHQDRYFTTASATNALIAAFTVDLVSTSNEPFRLSWAADTPAEVQALVAAGTEYLTLAALAGDTNYECAFFSGSIHAFNSLPFFFPANTILLMNDTSQVVNCSSEAVPFGDLTFQAVQGQMSEADYQHYLTAGCAGTPAEPAYRGLNDPSSPWPFWSSRPLSQALGLSAVAEASVLFRDA
jgi:hypothetical protein